MLQITFLALGLSGLLFAIAYFFKKYQRGILWAAALILFIGTSLMLGLGLIKIVENGEANHLAVFSVILSFACSGIFACGAEKIHEATIKKASTPYNPQLIATGTNFVFWCFICRFSCCYRRDYVCFFPTFPLPR